MLAGLWEGIIDALNESGLGPDALQMIDSTVVRAHHQAAGAKGGLRSRVLAVQGVASRPHLRVNGAGLPMRSDITPGQTSDYLGFDLVMDDSLPEPAVLLADCAAITLTTFENHGGAERRAGDPAAQVPQAARGRRHHLDPPLALPFVNIT